MVGPGGSRMRSCRPVSVAFMRLWNDRDNSRIMHIVMRDTAAGGYRERILLSYPLDLMSPYY